MNIHATKKKTETIANTFIAEGLVPNTEEAKSCGILESERTQDVAAPAATKINTTDVTTAEESAILGIFVTLIVLKTTISRSKAYTTDTAAASVGENSPEYIPPIIIAGNPSGKSAFLKETNLSDRVDFFSGMMPFLFASK